MIILPHENKKPKALLYLSSLFFTHYLLMPNLHVKIQTFNAF